MVEPEPENWVPVQASCTNNTMFFSVFRTKLFWSRSQRSQDSGARAKNLMPGAGTGAWNLSTDSTALHSTSRDLCAIVIDRLHSAPQPTKNPTLVPYSTQLQAQILRSLSSQKINC